MSLAADPQGIKLDKEVRDTHTARCYAGKYIIQCPLKELGDTECHHSGMVYFWIEKRAWKRVLLQHMCFSVIWRWRHVDESVDGEQAGGEEVFLQSSGPQQGSFKRERGPDGGVHAQQRRRNLQGRGTLGLLLLLKKLQVPLKGWCSYLVLALHTFGERQIKKEENWSSTGQSFYNFILHFP